MIYVFDTNSLSNVLNHYYCHRFPSFWEKLDDAIRDGWVISVRESKFELEDRFSDEALERLVKHNSGFFTEPTTEELAFIRQIYSESHFQQNLERKKLTGGGYLADPFLIAKARAVKGVVVTEEDLREHAAKIPNICKHFGIGCVSLEGFLLTEDWKF
ncbi:MAG: DUF4411 family protein [Chloroflexi bacterium]|nr:DUF4411 family protein [Chloroflexota bacterium]